MDKVPDTDKQPTDPNQLPTDSPKEEVSPGDNGAPKVNGIFLKGILKVKSEPILSSVDTESLPETDTVTSPTSTITTDDVTLVPKQITKPPRKKVHGLGTTTTLSYENPAFESEGTGSDVPEVNDQHLVDVVDKVILNTHDAQDWHPYGRTNLYNEMLNGKQKGSLVESEKVILWFVFTIMLVGMAGGIIFLSETYTLPGNLETATVTPCNDTI